jgi:hypothetical protein
LKNQFTKLFSDDECIEIINFFEKKEDWNLKIQLDENEEIYAHYYVRVFNELEFVKNKFKNFIESEFSFKVHEVNIYALKYYQNFKFGRHIDRAYHKESNKDFVYNINIYCNPLIFTEKWCNTYLFIQSPFFPSSYFCFTCLDSSVALYGSETRWTVLE